MSREPWILGLSCSHNGAAALLHGDELVVAIQEERLTREKRAWIQPGEEAAAVAYCCSAAGISVDDLDLIVCAALKGGAPAGKNVLSLGHHRAHAWAAFATSGFRECAVLVVDGAGSSLAALDADERAVVKGSTSDGREHLSIYAASPAGLVPVEKHALAGTAWLTEEGAALRRFHSLGGMFSAVAEKLFGSKWEAGKVMGLAPYGEPTIPVEEFVTVGDTFSFHLPRAASDEDLCASVQAALEHALRALLPRLSSRNLAYAGGVALNGIANESVFFAAEGDRFDDVYVMPAAEDSGCALGCAYYGLFHLEKRLPFRRLTHDSLGRRYARAEIDAALAGTDLVVIDTPDAIRAAAEGVAAGEVVAFFSGGSELGPRALGHRSIVFDPRRPDGKDHLNARVKHREAFRPFAPAVLLDEVDRWFAPTKKRESPFMLRVRPFRDEVKERVPAVVHVDGTGRLQTLRQENGAFFSLVSAFHDVTGVPLVLNTSFNVAGEPIVESPADAVRCMRSTGIDALYLDGVWVKKKKEK